MILPKLMKQLNPTLSKGNKVKHECISECPSWASWEMRCEMIIKITE